jgi:hypothetical protein
MRSTFYSGVFACFIAAGLHAIPTKVQAQNSRAQPRGGIEFPSCDGFGPVMPGGDGITTEVGGFWVARSDRVRRPPDLGRWIDNCSAAIALLDRAYPNFQLRKISLLQSRAAHKLAVNDTAGALEDLTAADAVLPNSTDEFYMRSLGINTDLIRIYALVELDKIAEAETVARRVIARRPMVRTITAAIFTAFGDKASQAFNDELLANLVKYHPNSTTDQFVYKFETGRFAEAIALYDTLSTRLVQDTNEFGDRREIDQTTEDTRVRQVQIRMIAMYRKTYALAALGKEQEAEAALKETQDYFVSESTDPPPLTEAAKKGETIRAVVVQQANMALRTRMRPAMTAWTNVIMARLAANRGAKDAAVELLRRDENHLPGFAFADAWQAAGQTKLNDPREALPSEYRSLILGLEKRSLKDLFALLLDADTANRSVGKVAALDRMFTTREAAARGGCEEKPSIGNVSFTCFKGTDATLAVTEEQTLLRAAILSLADQKPYFIILKRDDIRSSVTPVTNYGIRGQEIQLGYSTSLEFEKRTSNDNCVRCVDALAVKAALEPIYGTSAPITATPSATRAGR